MLPSLSPGQGHHWRIHIGLALEASLSHAKPLHGEIALVARLFLADNEVWEITIGASACIFYFFMHSLELDRRCVWGCCGGVIVVFPSIGCCNQSRGASHAQDNHFTLSFSIRETFLLKPSSFLRNLFLQIQSNLLLKTYSHGLRFIKSREEYLPALASVSNAHNWRI